MNKIFNRILIATLCCLAISASFAFPEEPPRGSDPKPFNVPERQRLSLDNGLQASMITYGKIPKVNIQLVIQTGSLNENGKTWISRIAADFLKEGTPTRSAENLAKETARMGGEVNVSASWEYTTVSATVLSEFAPELIALLADTVQNPSFPESELERLRANYHRQLALYKSQAQRLVSEIWLEMLYPNHSFGDYTPDETQLDGYTMEDIKSYYQSNFGAKRTHVYVAGKFDKAKVEEAIHNHFKDWAAGPDPLVDPPKPEVSAGLELLNRPDSTQASILLGLPVVDASHEDYIPLTVVNALLGGMFSSRVTSNIREDKGYTYSPFSILRSYSGSAYWFQSAAVTIEKTGPALTEIYNEIERMRTDLPSPEEMDMVRNYLGGTFVIRNSSAGGIISQLRNVDRNGHGDDYLRRYVQAVNNITPEQMRDIARKYLNPENMHLAVVGDLTIVTEQLKSLPQLNTRMSEILQK